MTCIWICDALYRRVARTWGTRGGFCDTPGILGCAVCIKIACYSDASRSFLHIDVAKCNKSIAFHMGTRSYSAQMICIMFYIDTSLAGASTQFWYTGRGPVGRCNEIIICYSGGTVSPFSVAFWFVVQPLGGALVFMLHRHYGPALGQKDSGKTPADQAVVLSVYHIFQNYDIEAW